MTYLVTTIDRFGNDVDRYPAEKSTGTCDAPLCAVPAMLFSQQEETEGLLLDLSDDDYDGDDTPEWTHVCWDCLGGKGFRVTEI